MFMCVGVQLFGENPDDTLVGREFVECVVRIAHQKFQKEKTLVKSVEMFFDVSTHVFSFF